MGDKKASEDVFTRSVQSPSLQIICTSHDAMASCHGQCYPDFPLGVLSNLSAVRANSCIWITGSESSGLIMAKKINLFRIVNVMLLKIHRHE